MKVEMDERLDTQEPRDRRPEFRPPSRGPRILLRLLIVVLVLAAVAGIVVAGILPRLKARKTLQADTTDLATRRVSIIHPKRAAASQEILLPASIQAFTEAPIYARTNGYLKKWYVDMGARVKAGQLLADIDTPEIEQQIQQARADIATVQANYNLAAITSARYQDLLKTNSVAQQDADNASGNMDARKAALQSAQYNLKRLEETQSFSKIYAPFDGVITLRNTDTGQLIDSGSGGGPARAERDFQLATAGPARELFHISAVKKLRVFVNVPQIYSRAAKPGLVADITLAEFPGRTFHGTLVRTSNAIESASRTLLTEIDVDNPTGEILPGAYGEVHLKLPTATPAYLLPINTLIFRSDGLRVGVVQEGKRVVLTPITLGRDFGSSVEVISGLNGDESVVVNPSDSLVSGEKVEISKSADAAADKGQQ